ncbi:unnamed protein product [Bursaphelenchus xylophilus]|uniref:(pine wood nematode) hypothetical protein n=1 Tax=Bursaphelenchus xylophilus TaxID=6326 RepID=A0A1I7RZD6_BURXY|nr:unnamed protein product [Bursaphelenchus xylophilus]CAG9106556.1 unnamed protein product [Bursaphelenchus xylophilus]
MRDVAAIPFVLSFLLPLIHSKRHPFLIRPHYGDSRCERESTPGDCNVQHCIESGLGEACESRYVRFLKADGRDYSRKTCRCLTEPLCAIMPSNKQGCVSYSSLGSQAQRLVRKWTMSESDRESIALQRDLFHNEYQVKKPLRLRFKHSNLTRYTDSRRHEELLKGKTRFCCRLHRIHKRAQHLRLKEEPSNSNTAAISVIPMISILGLYYT